MTSIIAEGTSVGSMRPPNRTSSPLLSARLVRYSLPSTLSGAGGKANADRSCAPSSPTWFMRNGGTYLETSTEIGRMTR